MKNIGMLMVGGLLVWSMGPACSDSGTSPGTTGDVGEPDGSGGDGSGSGPDVGDPDGGPEGDVPEPPVEGCGDGTCGAGEDWQSCAEDCAAPATLECLETGCGDQLDACMDLEACAGALACALACDAGDAGCVDGCAADVSAAVGFIFGELRACGDVECDEPAEVCGDGVCDAGEDAGTCPDDCATGPGPTGCLEEQCGDSYATCLADPVCLEGFECAVDCQTDSCYGQCFDGMSPDQGQRLAGILTCYQDHCEDAPVCGDGVCAQGEQQSCPADCQGGECGDGVCQQGEAGECPDDCCGDGVCQGYEQQNGTCPEDCEGPGPECGDGTCSQGEAGECPEDCCGDGFCQPPEAQSGSCPEDCEGGECGDGICQQGEMMSCPDDCGGAPECGDGQCSLGEQLSCPEDCGGGAECGDGTCDQGEQWTCPEDCGGSGCGDGVCDQGEQWWCPQDCEGPAPECGDGACDEGENPFNCPDDCGAAPECGDGSCDLGENAFTCPEDCVSGDCGDGVCGDGENPITCPDDCDPGPNGELIACAAEACPLEVSACLSDPACSGALDCILTECQDFSDYQCLLGCAQEGGLGETVIDVGMCIYQSGCL